MPIYNGITVNQPQYEGITHSDGPMLVIAGPGSGKTLVITQRIQYLIQEHKISPSNILVITFTKASAVEMEERFKKISEGSYYPVTFGTFHSIFFNILKTAYHYNFQNIITAQEKRDILTSVAYEHLPESDITQELLEVLLSEIAHQKNSGKTIADYETTVVDTEIFRKILKAYQEETNSKRKLDFEDMVLQCYYLLKTKPEVLKFWQDKYTHILIDEFQDINPIQFRVIQLLAMPQNNLFVVGDDDQSIYGFRGSDPNIMLSFQTKYPTSVSVLLDTNYRSREDIVTTSISLINHNKSRFPKKSKASRKGKDNICVCEFPSREAQNENTVALIEQYLETNNNGDYSDIAILSRTKSFESNLIEKLIAKKIPFVTKEKIQNIYQHFIAVDLLSYLKFACIEPRRAYLYQILNKPNRYIVRKSVEEEIVSFQKMENYYQDNRTMIQNINQLEYDINMMKTMTPYAAINFIRKGIGYQGYVKELAKKNKIEFSEYEEILDNLSMKAKEFDQLEDWLLHISYYEEELKRQNRLLGKNTETGVAIMTIHGSKGLEFPIVIIQDCNEGIIPHKKAITLAEIEEERRIFFVGMTRTKELLYLFYVDAKKDTSKEISRFLTEINIS